MPETMIGIACCASPGFYCPIAQFLFHVCGSPHQRLVAIPTGSVIPASKQPKMGLQTKSPTLHQASPNWKKYMLSSACSAQICLCIKIFSACLVQINNCTKNFSTCPAQMDDRYVLPGEWVISILM